MRLCVISTGGRWRAAPPLSGGARRWSRHFKRRSASSRRYGDARDVLAGDECRAVRGRRVTLFDDIRKPSGHRQPARLFEDVNDLVEPAAVGAEGLAGRVGHEAGEAGGGESVPAPKGTVGDRLGRRNRAGTRPGRPRRAPRFPRGWRGSLMRGVPSSGGWGSPRGQPARRGARSRGGGRPRVPADLLTQDGDRVDGASGRGG